MEPEKNKIQIGGGVLMGELIEELAKYNQSFPIGLSGITGVGYILTGGISPLSRSEGLAIEKVIELSGVWGNGEEFSIKKPNSSSPQNQKNIWRALTSAAPYLAIITGLSLQTQKIPEITVIQSRVNDQQLLMLIKEAEAWPDIASLQWAWGEEIEVYIVISNKDMTSVSLIKELTMLMKGFSGLKQTNLTGLYNCPPFPNKKRANSNSNKENHSEVLGLIGPEWKSNCKEIISEITYSMRNRPNLSCHIAAQQLGGITNIKTKDTNSFIYSGAMWKPWITASWPADDKYTKQRSIDWLEKFWSRLEPYCPGIHLAQMHPHLDWHKKEIEKTFKEWLPALKELKASHDPMGNMPSL